ncbi:MAG: redoxin domain-containing protein [Myxococcota bacterium]
MIHFGVAILSLLLATPPQTAAVGKPAPDFTAMDETGASYELAKLRGKAVVLEWTNPDCPFVERHYSADTMEKLATTLGAKDVVWLAVNSTHSNTPADTKAWKAAQGFAYPTLQDADGTIGHLYGARTTPHLFVIDADGVLRYAGAIDDDPDGDSATPTNYVGKAVAALLASSTPDPSETKPYGCSVKYK